jgi:predicted transposase/invertase (TIGR01784 family)
VLIFPTRGVEPDQATIHRALLSSDQVQSLYLNELEVSSEQSVERNLFQLMVAPQETLVEQAKSLITRARRGDGGNLSAAEIIDIVATIAVYKFVNLNREEVEAMLGLTLEQTRVYQEAKEEGREEGRLQAKLEIVSILLEMGLSLEQIAERLQLDLSLIQSAVNPDPQQ